MMKSKAIDIIKTLNKEEFTRLGKFLSSPFFNTNINLIKLYRILKPYYPLFNNVKLTKHGVFKSIYGISEYNDQRLRKLFSEFYKELNRYLVMLGIENDEVNYNIILLKSLRIKKLDSLFLKKFSESNELIDKMDLQYENYFEKFSLQAEYILFYLDRGEQHKIAPNILEQGNYMIFYFLSDIILAIRNIDTNREKFGYDPEPNLPEAFLDNFNMEKFFDYLDRYEYKDKELINLYYIAFLAFRNFDEEKYYFKLQDLVMLNWDKLSKAGRYVIISYLINYCNKKIQLGKSEFEMKLYKVYKLFFEYGLHRPNNGITIRFDILLHISDIFTKVGKVNEIKQFMDDNISDFLPEQRNNMISYCNALVDFESKKYGDALKNIAHIKTNTLLFKNRIKILQMKIYYEMGLYDEAKANAVNCRKFFVINKNASGQGHEQRLKFLSHYQELIKIRFEKCDGFAIKELKKNINQNGIFEETLWVRQKINELTKIKAIN